MSAAAAVLYAVVIGWNGGPSPEVPALRYADDDAAAWAALLRDAGARTTLLARFDEETRAVQGGLVPDGPPTRDRVFAAIADVEARMAVDVREGRAPELYFVYSGHGDVDGGEGFVMLDGQRLTRSDLRDRILGGHAARRTHVVVDACKSYYLVYPRGEAGSRRRRDAPFADARTPADLDRVGFLLSTSAAADSHEWEEFQGGVFSHELRSALRGVADADGDGAISYAEIGAFVARANAAIPNPRFRPSVTVSPPRADPLGLRAPALAWASPAPARTLALDLPPAGVERPGASAGLGRFSVEDERGRRLVDGNLAAPGTLHLPAGTVYVAAASGEYELPPGAPGQSWALSRLEAHPHSTQRRGAVHAAFRLLFREPFGADSVTQWLAHPEAPTDEENQPPAWPARLRVATGAIAIAASAAGLGATFGALLLRDAGFSASQQDRATGNQAIAALTGASIGLYAVGGASALTWVILQRWPRPRTAVSLLPGAGPGDLGLSLSGRF